MIVGSSDIIAKEFDETNTGKTDSNNNSENSGKLADEMNVKQEIDDGLIFHLRQKDQLFKKLTKEAVLKLADIVDELKVEIEYPKCKNLPFSNEKLEQIAKGKKGEDILT